MSDIESLNKSFKHKNTEHFINTLNQIYMDNFKASLGQNTLKTNEKSLFKTPDKSIKNSSYDKLEEGEMEFTLERLKKIGNLSSPKSLSNKFASESTHYMSEEWLKNNIINSIDSKIQSLNFSTTQNSGISPFLLSEKTNPISNLSSIKFPNENMENFISQNLIITDEVVKLIVIGSKGVGKTLLIDKICENIKVSQNYEPTQR